MVLGMWDWRKTVHAPLRGGGIRRRLLMWGLSLFGVALTIVVAASYTYTVRQIERDAAELQTEIASVTADNIRNFVRRKIERFSDNADAVSLYPLGSKEQQLLLGLLVKNDSSFSDASIINSEGMEVVKVSDIKVYFPSDLTDQSKSPKFIKALKGEDYIGPVYTSTRAQPYVTLAIPLWGTAQSIVGVASAEADLSFLWEVIGKINFATAGYAYLVDEHGNLIAHKDATLVLKRLDLRQVDGVQKFLRNPARSDPTPAQEGRGLLDKPVLTTYAPVPELGWAVILEEPIDAALANVELLKRYALALLTIALFAGAAVIAWVSSKMTGPIRELHQGAEIIGSGNLDYRVNIETGDEIEWLGEEFNKMAGELKISYATLEQKVKDKTGELENANSELEQANRSLLRANKAKDEFLSVMSHELRTPLNVVMGYSQMVKDGILGQINPEQESALEKVIGRSKDLLSMISEILQVTSIEAGKVKAEMQEIYLGELLDELRSTYEIPLDKKLTFNWDYPSERRAMRTDGGKLKHILQNLINNAIKFTDKGHITVSARYSRETKIAEFKVADTGTGIQEDLLPLIFEMFRQLDSSQTRNHGGAGVGLYIVKKYLDILGGKIQVESQVGRGSVFTVTIPC
ncbi:MAG TPA: sensor histidine kinase [Candidatus Binatia bacterium]|nr:sensor histidine kinase [Candidatus Binatia bacterium]